MPVNFPGVPTRGGTTNQVWGKRSSTPNDDGWLTQSGSGGGAGVPAGGTTGQILSKTTDTDFDTGWTPAPSGGASLTALHSGLLATKVWSGSAYVWPTGTAPDTSGWTNIVFVDPTGTHDPATSSGGRAATNDLWETGGTGPPGANGQGVPVGGTATQVLTKNSATNYDTSWQTPTGGGGSIALHSALLATKVWSTSSSAYIWPGDGTAPDSTSYTNIAFIDPDGTHDPKTSTGGRINPNDLWETGVTSTGSGGGAPSGPAGGSLAGSYPNPTLAATAVADLNTFTSTLKGLTPASGGGTTNFLRADGTWNAPGGGTTTLTPTPVKTAAYIAAVGELVLVDLRTAAFNVTLPTTPANGSQVGLRVRYRTLGSGFRAAFVAGATDTTDSFGVAQYEEWETATYDAVNHVWYSTNGFVPSSMPLNRLSQADGALTMGGYVIGTVGDATAGSDALNRQTGDARYLQPSALHSALLAVKVWSSTQYVWSGDGTAPDANAYTSILFVDPTGLHDPATSTGGRSNANDLWETGVSSSGGGSSSPILATKQYNPVTNASVAATTTSADVDATNLVITFTAPTSGTVMVDLSSVAFCPASNTGMGWSLRSGAADVAGTFASVAFNPNAENRYLWRNIVAGLTPSNSYTWKWGHRIWFGSSGAATTYGADRGPATMTVWGL